MAFAGAAESGTVILVSGADNPTTLNFLPEAHIVVMKVGDLHASYEEAWAKLREDLWARQHAAHRQHDFGPVAHRRYRADDRAPGAWTEGHACHHHPLAWLR